MGKRSDEWQSGPPPERHVPYWIIVRGSTSPVKGSRQLLDWMMDAHENHICDLSDVEAHLPIPKPPPYKRKAAKASKRKAVKR